MRITGGLRITGGMSLSSMAPELPGLYVPTGTQSNYFGGGANFEMGTWSSSDPSTVPDVSISGHTFGLNNNAAGSTDYYHFYNTSAQANEWDWPTDMTPYLAIMGWFAFGSFNEGSTTMVSRNDGGPGWAFRVDSGGTVVNLVKYGDADQTITLNTPLTTNTWHFIAVTQNNGTLQFLVDGDMYTTSGSTNTFASSGGPVRLQYDPYAGGNQNVDMWMRDVKITQTNTQVEDLMTLYNTTKTNYGY